MILLADSMSLITPDWGLFFWTCITFILLWLILGKYAFTPIKNALRDREESIRDALSQADKAKEEMAQLQSGHEQMLREAREERAVIIKQAKETGDKLVNNAKEKAKAEASKIVEESRLEIHNQKMAAIIEVKNSVGKMSLDIAEKVLRKELNNRGDQESYIAGLVNDIKLN